jgi:dTDP-4-amino-4,6-dideoxygalactose transaminase
MSEVHAAMGLTNLGKLSEVMDRCRRIYETYVDKLVGIPGLRLRRLDSDHEERNHSYVIAELEEDVAGLSRDQVLDILWAENVLARRYFYPGCHRMVPYRTMGESWDLALTDAAARCVIALPAGAAISLQSVEVVCALIRFVIENANAVRELLTSTETIRPYHV